MGHIAHLLCWIIVTRIDTRQREDHHDHQEQQTQHFHGLLRTDCKRGRDTTEDHNGESQPLDQVGLGWAGLGRSSRTLGDLSALSKISVTILNNNMRCRRVRVMKIEFTTGRIDRVGIAFFLSFVFLSFNASVFSCSPNISMHGGIESARPLICGCDRARIR